jgi:hypothetical protein
MNGKPPAGDDHDDLRASQQEESRGKSGDFSSAEFRDPYQDVPQATQMHGCLKVALIAGAVILLLVSACFGIGLIESVMR